MIREKVTALTAPVTRESLSVSVSLPGSLSPSLPAQHTNTYHIDHLNV